MPQNQLPMAFSQPHAHLRLSGRVRRGARIKTTRAVPAQVRHPDQRSHGAAIAAQVAQLRAMHAKRVPVLGVDPALVIVLLFNAPPELAALHAAQLHVLEWLDDRVVVAAPGNAELEAFSRRVAAYSLGPRAPKSEASPAVGQAPEQDDGPEPVAEADASAGDGPDARAPTAAYQGLLDRIDEIRAFGPDDVPTPALEQSIVGAGPADPLRVDIQCWCPEDPVRARAHHEQAAESVEAASGRVLDRTLRHVAGLSLIRAEIPAGAVGDLARTGLLRRIDVLPRPDLSPADTLTVRYERLPDVLMPREGSPVAAIVDSGIRSAHPLLAPAVAGVLAQGIAEGHDLNGHGTFVASLALHGSLEPLLASGAALRPAGRLVSVRVLDDTAGFPQDALWEANLLLALETAADAGAQVVNLSLGDERAPYSSERPTPLGAAVDDFVRRRGVVVVVSAGNYRPEQYRPDPNLPTGYAHAVLDDPGSGLLDPASSALALTVGALAGDDGQGIRRAREDIDRVALGGQGLPSPATRRGPGARGMIKPDLAAPGGTYEHETISGRALSAPHRGVVGAAAVPPDRLLTSMSGTSPAAPLVTHSVLRALGENPGLTANAAKALVLLSAAPHENWFAGGMTDGAKRLAAEALGGYGRPDAERAARSTDHRTVLLAENAVPADGVHLYRVQIPSSFFASGGWRRLSVSLVYDPPVRATRLEYVASNMHVNLYRGLSVKQVAAAYILDDETAPTAAEPTPPTQQGRTDRAQQ